MNDDLANIHYSPVWSYNYSLRFQEVEYEDKTLSDAERKEFVSVIDEAIEQYVKGLPIMYNGLETFSDQHNEYHMIYHTVTSIMLFVLLTTIDCMVASKYFILADKDYDRRYMRGKMRVILNEGFKRLYGFDEKTYKNSEWDRLLPLLGHFPEEINRQYRDLTYHLERHAKSSTWWKEERNLETHLDAVKLYESRQEEIVESHVMKDLIKLFSTLTAISDYLGNVHAYLFNFLVDKYKRGELIEE